MCVAAAAQIRLSARGKIWVVAFAIRSGMTDKLIGAAIYLSVFVVICRIFNLPWRISILVPVVMAAMMLAIWLTFDDAIYSVTVGTLQLVIFPILLRFLVNRQIRKKNGSIR
jgi:hypothetical protein